MSVPGEQERPRPRASFETRRDVEAALEARRELGAEFEEHIAAGLADRVEQLAAQRTAEVQRSKNVEKHRDRLELVATRNRFVLGIISLGAGIPITGIAGATADLPGIAIAWLGIVGVNVANALGSRPKSD